MTDERITPFDYRSNACAGSGVAGRHGTGEPARREMISSLRQAVPVAVRARPPNARECAQTHFRRSLPVIVGSVGFGEVIERRDVDDPPRTRGEADRRQGTARHAAGHHGRGAGRELFVGEHIPQEIDRHPPCETQTTSPLR